MTPFAAVVGAPRPLEAAPLTTLLIEGVRNVPDWICVLPVYVFAAESVAVPEEVPNTEPPPEMVPVWLCVPDPASTRPVDAPPPERVIVPGRLMVPEVMLMRKFAE